jgi:hypothetical protein
MGEGGGGSAAAQRGISEVPSGFVARATRGNGRVVASTAAARTPHAGSAGALHATLGQCRRCGSWPRQLAQPRSRQRRRTSARAASRACARSRAANPVRGHELPAPTRPHDGVVALAPGGPTVAYPSLPRAAHVRGPTRVSALASPTASARAPA